MIEKRALRTEEGERRRDRGWGKLQNEELHEIL
jgi:hypothetical protein